MKRFLIAGLAVLGIFLAANVTTAEEEKPTTVSGVLIDTKCGKGKNEEAAAKHPKACAIKCEESGYAIVVGDKMWTLDEKGNKLAKAYLAKEETTTKVKIEGTPNKEEMTMAVLSIKPAEEKKG